MNPTTGKPWSESAWLAATRHISDATRSEAGPAPVYGNGLSDGAALLRPGSLLHVVEELGRGHGRVVRPRPDGAGRGLPSATMRGRTTFGCWSTRPLAGSDALSMTKVWTTATARQRTAIQRYALGTFLLGYEPGHGSFSFRDDHGLTRYRPIWSVDLGRPDRCRAPCRRRVRPAVPERRRGREPDGRAHPRRAGIEAPAVRVCGRSRRGHRGSSVSVGAHSASILTNG